MTIATNTTTLSLPAQSLFGFDVRVCRFSAARNSLLSIAANHQVATVEFLAVNNLVTGYRDAEFGDILKTFTYVFPDGAHVAWAANWTQGEHRTERITARELMLELCAGAEKEAIPVYFYGSTTHVVQALAANMRNRFPQLVIVGHEPSVFRPLSTSEDQTLIDRINNSGAGLVFVGLGCPLQEQFVAAHRESINAVQLCVGSAFHFLSGDRPIPPRWAQRMGLEWLFRLYQEPRRLWLRYLRTNSYFLWMLLRHAFQANRQP